MGGGQRWGEAGGVWDDEAVVGADSHPEALEALPDVRLERGWGGARGGGGKGDGQNGVRDDMVSHVT